jgi:hypothetical protein
MLVGAPPFDGSDPRVVLSQHRHDTPPLIAVVRPDIPEPVDGLVRAMLAKVPADRVPSAAAARDRIDELLLGLATNELHGRRPPQRVAARTWRWPLRAVVVVLAIALGRWIYSSLQAPALDPNRILVFPLQDIGGADAGSDGLAVATYIGYALDGTRPLRWVEAHPLLRAEEERTGVSPQRAHALARSMGAGHFVDGAIVHASDSVAVILRLHSVSGDSLVRREGVTGRPGASVPQLGVRAIAALVPLLVEPGRRIDTSPLRDRAAPAIAKFLQGERAYRGSRLEEALALYSEAVSLDSAFALAAIKGALAARALDRDSSARALYAVAIRRVGSLPPRHASYAAGLGFYLSGDADSALAHFRAVLASDSSWADVWTAMAETYHHLLPNVANADSLATAAYTNALRRDSTLLLARIHLAEHDLHEGRLNSAHVRFALAADTSGVGRILTPFRWAVMCATQARADSFWTRYAAADPRSVLIAGKLLAEGASHAGCARAAFWSVLRSDTADVETRWGSLLTLHGLLIATNDTASLPATYAAGVDVGLPTWPLRMLAAAAGVDDPRVADSIATSRGVDYRSMNSATLWLRSTWGAHRGDRSATREIAAILLQRARESRLQQDSVLAQSASAMAAAAALDTSGALTILGRLRPHAPRADITWQPFAAHGLERLTRAQFLLARGRPQNALDAAALLEASEPVTYLLYYRQSLTLRLQAARTLGRADDIRKLAARLERLRPAGAALRAAG